LTYVNPNINKPIIREYPTEEQKNDTKMAALFVRLCYSKLTFNDMQNINQKDLHRVFKEIKDKKTSLEELGSKTGDDLYDYITGQGRLF